LDEFDQMLVNIVDKVLECSLGKEGAGVVFEYLELRRCFKMEIPQKLPQFSLELRKMFNSEEIRLSCSRAGVFGSALIIEETIIRMLCLTLAKAHVRLTTIHLGELRDVAFADFVSKVKEAYFAEKALDGSKVLQATPEVIIKGGETVDAK
jgi:hypothetical protein